MDRFSRVRCRLHSHGMLSQNHGCTLTGGSCCTLRGFLLLGALCRVAAGLASGGAARRAACACRALPSVRVPSRRHPPCVRGCFEGDRYRNRNVSPSPPSPPPTPPPPSPPPPSPPSPLPPPSPPPPSPPPPAPPPPSPPPPSRPQPSPTRFRAHAPCGPRLALRSCLS